MVADVERPAIADPTQLDNSDADMVIIWQGMSTAFEHPTHGVVGPVPYRRTGGHTGPYGVAFIAGASIPVGPQGIRSSFDVVPTIAELLGQSLDQSFSGTSLLNSCTESQ